MEPVWSVSKLSTESVSSRRELCSHRRRDKTVSNSRAGQQGKSTDSCPEIREQHKTIQQTQIKIIIISLLVEPGRNIAEIRRSQWNNKTYKAHKEHLQPGTNIAEMRRSQWNNKTYNAHKEHLQPGTNIAEIRRSQWNNKTYNAHKEHLKPGTNIAEIRRSQWNNKTYKAHKEHLQ